MANRTASDFSASASKYFKDVLLPIKCVKEKQSLQTFNKQFESKWLAQGKLRLD